MNILFVLHESFESPGAILAWANQHQHRVTLIRTYLGDAVPQSAAGVDFLVIMGGPQSPATTKDECAHFDAEAEIALIKSAIEHKCLILGVCLGAQLLAEAYGAAFEHSPHKEIGVFPITLTEAAKSDPIFSQFPHTFLMGHWHGDMPGVPQGAEILATSEGCPRQIIRFDHNVYGFQCHFEFTPQVIEDMIEHSEAELAAADQNPYIQNAETLRQHDYAEINEKLFLFLDDIANQVN